jgi:hypothetical protein
VHSPSPVASTPLCELFSLLLVRFYFSDTIHHQGGLIAVGCMNVAMLMLPSLWEILRVNFPDFMLHHTERFVARTILSTLPLFTRVSMYAFVAHLILLYHSISTSLVYNIMHIMSHHDAEAYGHRSDRSDLAYTPRRVYLDTLSRNFTERKYHKARTKRDLNKTGSVTGHRSPTECVQSQY